MGKAEIQCMYVSWDARVSIIVRNQYLLAHTDSFCHLVTTKTKTFQWILSLMHTEHLAETVKYLDYWEDHLNSYL